jgi:GTP cyclohydrolase IB
MDRKTPDPEKETLTDVQSLKDHRCLDIDRVGVKDIRYPIIVRDRSRGQQNTIASINMYVKLPHSFKGTHMSRFLEVLAEYDQAISIASLPDLLDKIRSRLDAEEAHIELKFPYFIHKTAPVSKSVALMDYQIEFLAVLNGDKYSMIMKVMVPVTSLCPCSKEISDAGAHNQRSHVTVSLQFRKFVWVEEIIDLVESNASCQLYTILKRPDEKYVTEKAYANPQFVEDMVRSVAADLEKDSRVNWFTVESENFESIHNHSAYALIEGGQKEY